MFKIDALTREPKVYYPNHSYNNADLNGAAQDNKKTIAILGGHGNEYSVSTIFYPPVLGPIQSKHPNFRFIAVDPIVGTPKGQAQIERQKEVLDKHGFAYDSSLHPDTFYKRLESGEINLDGAVLAIPVKYHLPEIKKLLGMFDNLGKQVPVMLEKPLGLVDEVGQFKSLFQSHPEQIFAADFSNGTNSLNFALENGLKDKIGDLEGIIGRFVEDGQYQELDVLIQAIKDRNMLRESINGGGAGLDMAVHSIVTQERFLEEALGLSLQGSKIKDVFLGRINHPEINASSDPHLETYWRVSAELGNGAYVFNDAGKGLDAYDYIVQINGDKGSLVISSGTVKSNPFVLFIPKDDSKRPELYLFKPGVGYKGIFENFLLTIQGHSEKIKPTLEMCMNTTSTSVEFVGDSYRFASSKSNRGVELIEHGRTPSFQSITKPPDFKFYGSSDVVKGYK